MIPTSYNSSLTGDPFLFHESLIVAKEMMQTNRLEQIKNSIVKNNLFNYVSTRRVQKRVTLIHKRLSNLDAYLLEKCVTATSDQSKIIVFYALFLDSGLVHDFVDTVISTMRVRGEVYLYDSHILSYLDAIQDNNETMGRQWSPDTVNKLRRVFKAIMREVGILERSGNRLNRLLVDEDITHHILQLGDRNFLHALGVEV